MQALTNISLATSRDEKKPTSRQASVSGATPLLVVLAPRQGLDC